MKFPPHTEEEDMARRDVDVDADMDMGLATLSLCDDAEWYENVSS